MAMPLRASAHPASKAVSAKGTDAQYLPASRSASMPSAKSPPPPQSSGTESSVMPVSSSARHSGSDQPLRFASCKCSLV
jgi:hypothetical protein